MQTWKVKVNLDGVDYACVVSLGFDLADVEVERSNRASSGQFQKTEVDDANEFYAVAHDAVMEAKDQYQDECAYANDIALDMMMDDYA